MRLRVTKCAALRAEEVARWKSVRHVMRQADSKTFGCSAPRRVFSGVWSLAVIMLATWAVPSWAGALSESLSESAQVSVLTASPGKILYAAFGHTAIRGTTLRPAQTGCSTTERSSWTGVLRPVCARQNGLSTRGSALWAFPKLVPPSGPCPSRAGAAFGARRRACRGRCLEWNALPENEVYAYVFFRDNCATKVIAVLEEVFGDRFDMCFPTDSTYLEALRPYTSGHPWSAFLAWN